MKTLWLLLVASVSAVSLHAQFYAPATEYHDICQRTFPVEAARVLAWQRGPDAAAIAEITWQVETSAKRETRWTIQWRDAAGVTVRERTVHYEAVLLTRGAEFFREVFAQICGDDWKVAPTPRAGVERAYWDGARRAGVSRAEAITAARRFIADNPRLDAALDAAELAGLLGHGALPMLASQFTLDSVLLSRAAAWLCMAEALDDKRCEAGWPPLLFLAGRERLAGEMWRALPTVDPAGAATGERFWEAMLRAPSVAASFDFTARRENRQHAFAAMAYHARCDREWREIMKAQAYRVAPAPSNREFDVVLREYEYAPLFERPWEVSMDAAFLYGMRAWLRLLDGFVVGSVDSTRLLASVPVPEKSGRAVIPRAVDTVAPLLDLALEASSGPLRPVAVASTADVLGFGWESTGTQLAERVHRLRESKRTNAEAFKQAITPRLKSLAPFLPAADRESTVTTAAAERLQFIAAPRFQAPRSPEPGAPDTRVRRCWLWKDGGAPAIAEMIERGVPGAIVAAVIQRMISEGGQLAVASLVNPREPRKLAEKLAALDLESLLLDAVPSNFATRSSRITEHFRSDADTFRRAQELERLSWQYGVFGDSRMIFQDYLQANALASARRYASRVGLLDWRHRMEEVRFTFAWLEGDDDAMHAAAEAAREGNGGPLLAVLHALWQDDHVAAAGILEVAPEKDVWWSKLAADMRAFLPLLPALCDRAHPDHARALDGFPASEYSAFSQWVLLRKAGLAGEEAVSFLGGEEALPANQMLIAAVRGDARQFEKLYQKHAGRLDAELRPVIAHLRRQLLQIAPPREEPDLMPAGARSLEESISEPFNRRTVEARLGTARVLAETFDAPDADAGAKFEAARQIGREIWDAPGDAALAMLHPVITAMLRVIDDYPSGSSTAKAAELCVEWLDRFTPLETQGVLEKLAAHPNIVVADIGVAALQRRGKLTVAASKPIEFKFTAVDGREVDLEKLRGKVVLLDFWASWCGPCIAEMPYVVAAYENFHARGFEIVGISLDGKKAALEAAVREHKLPWPQFFGGEREDIEGFDDPLAKSLGLRGIPYACLLDKRGTLRHTGLRGERLAEAIERLLSE